MIGISLGPRSPGRKRTAWILAVAGPAAVALALVPLRSTLGLAAFLICTLLAVVVVAVVGGLQPALATMATAYLMGAIFYAGHVFTVAFRPDVDVLALIAFTVVGASIAALVDELTRLAAEQGALRRVATLVARGVTPEEAFTAVTEEIGSLFHADRVSLNRYESDGTATVVAGWERSGAPLPLGTNYPLEGENISAIVARTGRPARLDIDPDTAAALIREARSRSAIGAPVVVQGRSWGVIVAISRRAQGLSVADEARLADFTDLVATAVANAESRAELTASRARIVAAADDSRKRIERDLHDGAQQRLVSLGLDVRSMQTTVPTEMAELRAHLARVAAGLSEVVEELQELSRGIHPPVLARSGLGPALAALARRSALPVELDVRTEGRWEEQVEVAAYYVVSEALTNAAKHSRASMVQVEVCRSGETIEVVVRDDGVGGADPRQGSGLTGLHDRVEAIGGSFAVGSGVGRGTSLLARFPARRPEDYAPS